MNISYSSNPPKAVEAVVKAINTVTEKGDEVLWLLSGGSAISIAIEVSTQLNHPEKISITLADERYGKVDHEDSNWHQLIQAGFDFHPFASIPVLVGRSVAETVKHFSLILQKNDRTVIALLGMGPDGHTSGILPNSLAAYERDAPVMAYQGPDHMRITTTPAYLGTIDIAILYVTGRNKHEPLSRFITTDQDPIVYPVQYLKTIPDLRVITDMEKPNE